MPRVLALAISLLTLLVLVPAAGAYPHATGAAVPHNPANAHRFDSVPVEASTYDPATHCAKREHPGMLDMERWLAHHVAGQFWGSYRCEKWGKDSASLHAENRAIDWHLDAHSAADRREADRLFALLLAPDRYGNPQALARRMGVEELIFDCGYWGAGMTDFKPYSPCFKRNGQPAKIDDTTAHRDHVHIGMSKAGAAARTSFWR